MDQQLEQIMDVIGNNGFDIYLVEIGPQKTTIRAKLKDTLFDLKLFSKLLKQLGKAGIKRAGQVTYNDQFLQVEHLIA